jgi:hypothetical protein
MGRTQELQLKLYKPYHCAIHVSLLVSERGSTYTITNHASLVLFMWMRNGYWSLKLHPSLLRPPHRASSTPPRCARQAGALTSSRGHIGCQARQWPHPKASAATPTSVPGRGPIPRPPSLPWWARQAAAPSQGLHRRLDERARPRPHPKPPPPTRHAARDPPPCYWAICTVLRRHRYDSQFPISFTYLWSCINLFWTN